MCTDARKRKRTQNTERREDRGSRNWEGKKRIGRRRNEILANAFVFATWLHSDVTMEVIGIPRMSQCKNSVCAYTHYYMCMCICIIVKYR